MKISEDIGTKDVTHIGYEPYVPRLFVYAGWKRDGTTICLSFRPERMEDISSCIHVCAIYEISCST